MYSSLAEAKAKLIVTLKKRKALNLEIQSLRAYILSKEPVVDLDERNKAIYSQYKQRKSISELAERYKLSKGRIRLICDWYKAKEARRSQ